MIAIKKILVADDFSEHGDTALKYAAEFGRAFQAEVLLCHVVEGETVLAHLPPGGEGYFPPNLTQLLQESARTNAETRLADSGIENGSIHLPVGKPFVEIIRLAKQHDVDLIVVGTHGRGAIGHMLLGSVAERVVRKAPCPVLVVREGEHEFVLP
ncbi:MAG: universal stress protein [Planctomycetaceae bacterium]